MLLDRTSAKGTQPDYALASQEKGKTGGIIPPLAHSNNNTVSNSQKVMKVLVNKANSQKLIGVVW